MQREINKMTEKQVPGQLTREEAKNYILLTLDRFRVMTLHLNDNRSKLPSILNENKEILDLVYELEARNFYIDLMHLYLSDIFEVLSSEGYKEFLLKCKSISEKFCLKVKIPANITVVGEDIVEQFISELTEESLKRIRNNLQEVEDTKNLLLSQVVGININNENKNELETIISKRQEYEIAKKNYDQANHQIQILASSHCIDENAYKPYYKICEESKKIMDTILCDYPLVQYFKNKTEEAYLKRQITKTFDDINDAINKIINKIIEGKYPIWHFDSLISELLQKYSSNEAQIIKQQLEDMKKKEDFKDLFLTIGSITLSVLTLLIPGGVIAGLLRVKSGLQIANAAFSVASAINDIEDSVLYKQEVLSHIKVSPEVQELMNTENISLTDAQIQLLVALLSSTFVIFDLSDAKKSVDLLRKLDNLDNEAVQALKQSKRFGEKAFQNIDTITLNHIGKVKKATKVFDNLSTLDVKQIPEALNFFPNNLNTNVIWLSVVEKPAQVISDVKYNEVFEELTNRATLLKNPNPQAIERYFSSVNKAFSQEELVIVAKIKDGMDLPEIGVRLQSGAYDGFCKNEDIQQVFFTKLDEIAGKSYDSCRTPVENLMKRLGFTDEDVAKNMKIFDNPDGRMYLDVVVSRDKSVFKTVNWDDVEDRFIKYVNSLDNVELKAYMTDYPLIFEGNKINKSKLDEMFFNAFKSKEATSKGYSALTRQQKDFFDKEIFDKFNINQYFTGKGFTATIDENVFGTGEMVLESTGKETLPLSNANYMTYRYAVDKDCNIKLYKFYDEVK